MGGFEILIAVLILIIRVTCKPIATTDFDKFVDRRKTLAYFGVLPRKQMIDGVESNPPFDHTNIDTYFFALDVLMFVIVTWLIPAEVKAGGFGYLISAEIITSLLGLMVRSSDIFGERIRWKIAFDLTIFAFFLEKVMNT